MGNLLRCLNVSKNPELEILGCAHNKLMDLDISNNPALTCLDCYFNRLAELDISANSKLELSCDENVKLHMVHDSVMEEEAEM